MFEFLKKYEAPREHVHEWTTVKQFVVDGKVFLGRRCLTCNLVEKV